MRVADSSIHTIPCASLRVYERANQLAEPAGVSDDVFGVGLTDPQSRRVRYVIEFEGQTWVCEALPRIRMYLALASIAPVFGRATLDFDQDRLRHAMDRVSTDHPSGRPPVLDSAWHIPLTWFIAFDPAERILSQSAEGTTVRYLTSMTHARSRVAKATAKLRGRIPESVYGSVASLLDWLEEFSEKGLVELDYGGVAALFESDELADEDTVSEILGAIGNLADGYPIRSALLYRRAEQRWSPKAGIPNRN